MEIKGMVIGAAIGVSIIVCYQTIVENGNSFFIEKKEDRMLATDDKESSNLRKTTTTEYDYYYQQLTPDQQNLYIEMLSAIENIQQERTLTCVDENSIDLVFCSIMNDHPELFYIDGYKYTKTTSGDAVKEIVFMPTYIMTGTEIENYKGQVEAYISSVSRLTQSMNDEYEIAKTIYDYIITTCDYDRLATYNQNILSVIVNGRSVCKGYAKTMQLLLKNEGIKCIVVTGSANGESHIWNEAYINGNWYCIDPTWGDSSYSLRNDSSILRDSIISYEYFNTTTADLIKTHTISNIADVPTCTSIQDNYFVRENLLLEDYDRTIIAAAFNKAIVEQTNFVSFKCNNAITYSEIYDKLITQQEVFEYLNFDCDNIRYNEEPELLILEFYF